MSQTRNQNVISMKSFNTSNPAYRILTMATGLANTVKVWDTSLCNMIGASANESSVTGAAVQVVIGGTCLLMAGENISTGALIIAQTATGKAMHGTKAVQSSDTSYSSIFGTALEGISVGAYGEVLINIENAGFGKDA